MKVNRNKRFCYGVFVLEMCDNLGENFSQGVLNIVTVSRRSNLT